MTENAFTTIVSGLKLLKRHPILLIPAAVHHVAIIYLALLLVFFVLNFNYFEINSLAVYLAGVLLTLFISSFATAGSVGMAKEVIESGATRSKHLLSYGKKYTFKLVLAFLFITLIRTVFSLFWQPVLNRVGDMEFNADYVLDALNTDPSLLLPMFEALAVPVLIAVLATAAYLLLVSFMFYFVSYIIVIDNLSVFKSYRKSFKLLWTRPIRVISFVFLVTVIQMLVTSASVLLIAVFNHFGFPFLIGLTVNLVLLILLAAAMNIWVTRFYIILTGKKMAEMQ
ncbi:MAG: hypothetical protein LBE57_07715 [Methanosarcinales archaeon]|nr:hypothetical protein [Methanosarcinales archaeon]